MEQTLAMGAPKQIVFRYNGDPATEEHIADLEGEETIPAQGAVVDGKAAPCVC